MIDKYDLMSDREDSWTNDLASTEVAAHEKAECACWSNLRPWKRVNEHARFGKVYSLQKCVPTVIRYYKLIYKLHPTVKYGPPSSKTLTIYKL